MTAIFLKFDTAVPPENTEPADCPQIKSVRQGTNIVQCEYEANRVIARREQQEKAWFYVFCVFLAIHREYRLKTKRIGFSENLTKKHMTATRYDIPSTSPNLPRWKTTMKIVTRLLFVVGHGMINDFIQ